MLLKDIDPFVRHIRHFTISELSPSAGKDVKTRDNRIFSAPCVVRIVG